MKVARRLSRITLGLGITDDAVRGVALRRGEVAWTHEVILSPERSLPDAVGMLLSAAPRGRITRSRVFVAVGPAQAQLRRIRGLPPVRGKEMLAAIIRQDVGRYFLQDGAPLVTTATFPAADGSAWAGAIDEPVVHAVAEACRDHRFHLQTIAPTAALLGHAMPGGQTVWKDGAVVVASSFEGTALQESRRIAAALWNDTGEEPACLASALQGVTDGWRFADAFAAAQAGGNAKLVVRPHDSRDSSPSAPRLLAATAALVAGLTLLAIAPGIAASRAERDARAQLASLADEGRVAIAIEQQVRDSSRVLNELAAFRRGAPSTTLLLASLTRAIEPPTMLVNLRLDATGGTLTALTPSAASLLRMLASVPEISGPVISGSVTPEAPASAAIGPMALPGGVAATPRGASDARLERVAVRFHWVGERRVAR